MSGILKVGGSELINDNGGSGVLQWGSGVPSGSIVQVQYTQYTGSAAMSGLNTDTVYSLKDGNAITGTEILTVQLTPRISNSKFMIEAQWMGELVDAGMTWNSAFLFLRGSTPLRNSGTGNGAGIQVPWFTHPNDSPDDNSTGNGVYLKYFDEPNISADTATTWKLAFNQSDDASNQVVYTNQTAGAGSNPNDGGYERGTSFISVTEIAP